MSQTKAHTPSRSPKTKRHTPKNGESPSRQLLLDLERAMARIQVHESEMQKVRAFNRRSYYEGLEAWDEERTQADLAALSAATAKHDAVRHGAEAELEKYYREAEEEEKRKRAEDERLKREKQAREKAEKERKEREEADRRAAIEREKAAVAAKKVAEEKAKAEAEEGKRREREATAAKEKEEQDRIAKEASDKREAEKRANDEKTAQAAARAKAASQAQAQAQAESGGAPPELMAQHKRYLEIHKNLKKFRKEFMKHAKADPNLKNKVGDMRRALRTSVGQLTDSKEKGANKKPTDRIRSTLSEAMSTVASPPVNLTPYIYIDSASNPLTSTTAEIPSLLLYLLTMFSKAVVASFASECAVNPHAAEPIGTLVASIFGSNELQVLLPEQDRSTSLISVLLSKFHANIAVLFGIAGPENTQSGRTALGWRKEYAHDGDSEKRPVQDTRHYERMTGLAAGYASISLRNFSKTKLRNPYPPKHFWESLANIVNTPPAGVQPTHLIVLKNMVEVGVERFILFYGNVGVAALREALIEFPARLPAKTKESSAARGLSLLVDTFKKEKNLSL